MRVQYRSERGPIETCSRCGGSVRVIACIEEQDIIDRILAHLRDKDQFAPDRPYMAPPSRAPPDTLPLFAGKEPAFSQFNRQGRQRVVTAERQLA